MVRTPGANAKTKPQPSPGTLVLFVRHGITPSTGQVLPGRAAGLHLAEQGQQQAEAVAERIVTWLGAAASLQASQGASQKATQGRATPNGSAPAGRGRKPASPGRPRIAAVYASPMERTRETAAPIAKALGLKVVPERGLIECDFGEWTGAPLKELTKKPEWTTVQRYPSGFSFPGGESFSGMRSRMAETVASLCARHPGEAIVAVSHADPIKAVVSDALGTHLDLFQRIVVSPCSVTAITYHATGPVVLAVNSTGNLTELWPL